MHNLENNRSILRSKLSNICNLSDSKKAQEKLALLKSDYHHNISVVETRNDFSTDIRGFEYALGLHSVKNYLYKVNKLRSAGIYCISCDHFFAAWIDGIKKYLKEVNINDIAGGEIILYYKRLNFQRKELKHAGIVKNKNIIISKWGTIDVFEHSILEIPYEYGGEFSFFQKPDVVDIEKWFNEYLEDLKTGLNTL